MATSNQDRQAAARRRRSRRAMLIVTVVGVIAVVITATVFALSRGTREITENALSLHQADDTLRVATIARFQLGFAVHLASLDRELGSDFSEARERSIGEAAAALDQIQVGLADLEAMGATDELVAAASGFEATARRAIAGLEAGDSQLARLIVETELPVVFETFATDLVAERDLRLAAVEESDETTATWSNTTRFLLAAVIPLLIIILYREIVRRQQRQAELEIRLDAERQLSKAREDFIANASHELRTPLTSIYGVAQLLREQPDMPLGADEMVEIINGEAADLNRMIEDLLTTARLAAGQLRFEPEDVNVEEEVDGLVGPFIRGGADITTSVEAGTVHVDRLRQRQVLRNLISNATKYGGPHIALRGRTDGHWYEWTIADDGDGVPVELEERLFQRFIHQHSFQQAVAGGVGLGLSIVKSLAEGMGGTVSYEKAPAEVRFIVRVPLAVPATGEDAGEWVEGAA